MATNLMWAFGITHSDFHMEKTGTIIRGYFYLLFLIERFKGDIFDWEYPLLTESTGTFSGICLFTSLIDWAY